MTISRVGLIALPIAAMAMGCVQGSKDTPTAAESASVTQAAPPAPSARRTLRPNLRPVDRRPPPMMRSHAGRASEIFAAAHQLTLNDDQKAKLAKLDTPDPDGDPAMTKAFTDLHKAMADQVKEGKMDTAKLSPLYDAMDKAAQAEQDKEADELNQLHALLDATQRKTLVDSVKKRQSDLDSRFQMRIDAMKQMKAKMPSDKDRADQRNKRELERLTRMLSLDADQQKKVEPLLAARPKPPQTPDTSRHAEMSKKMDALLDAFEKDTFDAKKLDLGIRDKKPFDFMRQRATFLGKLLPILNPDQRTKLAASIERPGFMGGPGPMMGPGGRMMGRGGPMGGMGRGPMMGRMGMRGMPYTLPFEDPAPSE